MKLLILSDLHLELEPFVLPQDLDFDVVILAGDIHSPGSRGIEWARHSDHFGTTKPVILVPGNHEFYRCNMAMELACMRESAAGTNVHMLDGDEVVIDGVRFLGCTLWTDFALPIQMRAPGQFTSDAKKAMTMVSYSLNDYQLISLPAEAAIPAPAPAPAQVNRERLMTVHDTLAIHVHQRAWLESKLAEPFDGPTVVVTHHAPRRESVAARYAADVISAGFASDLPDALFDVPVLWIHGHVHNSFDYAVANCRVIANPRGYVRENGATENYWFDPGLLIELDAIQEPKP